MSLSSLSMVASGAISRTPQPRATRCPTPANSAPAALSRSKPPRTSSSAKPARASSPKPRGEPKSPPAHPAHHGRRRGFTIPRAMAAPRVAVARAAKPPRAGAVAIPATGVTVAAGRALAIACTEAATLTTAGATPRVRTTAAGEAPRVTVAADTAPRAAVAGADRHASRSPPRLPKPPRGVSIPPNCREPDRSPYRSRPANPGHRGPLSAASHDRRSHASPESHRHANQNRCASQSHPRESRAPSHRASREPPRGSRALEPPCPGKPRESVPRLSREP